MIPLSVFCVSWNPTELQFSTICTMVLLPHYLLVFGQNLSSSFPSHTITTFVQTKSKNRCPVICDQLKCLW